MTITTADHLINALGNNKTCVVIDKANIANAAAGQFHSLWRATGQPGQGAIPTAAAVCTNALTGAMTFTQQVDPSTSYLAHMEAACSNSSVTLEVYDRLMHMGGLVGNVTTAQTVTGMDLNGVTASNMVARRGADDFSEVTWWLEWYTDTGTTAATATVGVTYNDGTTGSLTGISLAATRRASFMQNLNGLIPAASSGKYIRAVNTVTLSVSTGTAGNFGVTATHKVGGLLCPVANIKWSADWASLPLHQAANSACLYLVTMPGTTSTGTIRGRAYLAHG